MPLNEIVLSGFVLVAVKVSEQCTAQDGVDEGGFPTPGKARYADEMP